MSTKRATKGKSPSKQKRRAESLHEMMEDARTHRERNKDLFERVRMDPDTADEARERMCADLRRVFEIPREIIGPSASRQRYREHGRYSTTLATYLFGTWAEFKRQAGIEPSLGVRRVERNIARTLQAQEVAKYADECVRPWDGAYSTLDMTAETVVLQIGSDFHSRFMDPFGRRVWLEVAELVKPCGVRYNGDVPDFPKLSTHRQLPGHFAMTLQEEIDFSNELFADTREATGWDCDHKWILGNHDARWIYAMADAAPIFCGLETNKFHQQFKLDELRVGLVARSTFLNPTNEMRQTDIAQNWETLPDAKGLPFWTTVHGWLCGKDAPRKHLDKFMTFGTNGHLHDPQNVSGGSLATGHLRWWQTGCMAWPRAVGANYIKGPIEATGWFTSFLIVSLFPRTRHVQVEEITVTDTAAFRDLHWEITQDERDQRAEMMYVAGAVA